MKRLFGSFGEDTKQEINQLCYQVKPRKFKIVEGWELPIRGGFTQVTTSPNLDTIAAYYSGTGEVPLYYAVHENQFYWSEQSLTIPSKFRNNVKPLKKGQVVFWSLSSGLKSFENVDILPRPPIIDDICLKEAIARYGELLLKAVEKRLNSLPAEAQNKVAISQSAGLDSFLITWALRQLDLNVFPITAGTSPDDWDIKYAKKTLAALNWDFYPVLVKRENIPELFREAILCYESPQEDNLRMASCNLAIARKCEELGCKVIFNGHGHDDMHGSEGLTLAAYQKYFTKGSPSERWRDARRDAFKGTGMDKMFASTFRRHGIHVRMPFYDEDLLRFVLSLPGSICPPATGKPFAVAAAKQFLPGVGLWSEEKYLRRGYGVGAGYYRNKSMQASIEYGLENAREYLKILKAQQNFQWFSDFHGF